MAVNKIDDLPAIVGMDVAAAGRTAGGAGLLLGAERSHAGIKKIF